MELKQCSLWKSTSDAGTSLEGHGRECLSGTISEPSVCPTPDASEAGKTSRGGNRKDEMLIGGMVRSGSSLVAYPANLPLAPASNEEIATLVGSGRRLSDAYPKSGPLGRFSRILLESETWGSPEFSLRWKLKATKCGCSVFQLAPSVRRTGESDTGSWPTPQEHDQTGPRGKNNTFSDSHYYPHDLATATQASWKTPHGMQTEGYDRNHGPKGNELGRQANGAITSSCLARTEKFVVRLLILSAWLMGYQWNYLKNWQRKSPKKNCGTKLKVLETCE